MSPRTFWSRYFSSQSSRTLRCIRTFRPRLEHLEDRTLLSARLVFDSAVGSLAIFGDSADTTIRQTFSSTGFLEVAVDRQSHSSDPTSALFDKTLAGASASTLANIQFNAAAGHDTLTLAWDGFENRPTGSLAVSAAGADVVTQDVTVAGNITIEAQRVTVSGALRASAIALAGSAWVTIEGGGQLVANQINVAADVFVNSGQLHADGLSGGQVVISARNILNAGAITADGSGNGDGGAMRIAFTGSYIDTAAAVTSASGGTAGNGGQLTIDGTGRLFSSGAFHATGSVGGSIGLFGREVVLDGATVNASGQTGGGSIRIGGEHVGQVANLPSRGWQVGNLPHNSNTVTATPAATIRADALATGDGGRVIVWSDEDTHFGGSVSAHGGPAGGAGGFLEVSSKGTLNYGGSADAGAPAGKAGTLLLDPKNLIISAAPVGIYPQYELIDPHPTAVGGFGAGAFGTGVTVLSNGNVVVINLDDNFGGTAAGAVYLFNGLTGALISSLVGSHINDRVGQYGFALLSNGNFVVESGQWNGLRGAATWASSTAGVSGAVSASNSLIGSNAGDHVGADQFFRTITALSNGNYLVASIYWNSTAGAVTWGNGTTGVSGAVSADNSLVGNPDGGVGSLIVLSNGNYLLQEPTWNDNRGAVTWASGITGVSGFISADNSLVGSNPGDKVGYINPYLLSNGNYVIHSPYWSEGRAAVTWGSGTTGVRGVVSADNSLVGSNPREGLGFDSIDLLSNGNYVVSTSQWNGARGAVTWGSGATGVSGFISAANSLVGGNTNDRVGGYGIIVLSTGNYVVGSPSWNGGRGAVTWVSGATGIDGEVSAGNSLVGNSAGDHVGADQFGVSGYGLSGYVSALSNGNYLVRSPAWDGQRGAVTLGNGVTGTTGLVSPANSLVGSYLSDQVGLSSVIPLTNGNYVVPIPTWNNNRGAVAWVSGTTGTSGFVSPANSLVGSSANDMVGSAGAMPLNNGNYVVKSPSWNGNRGAATWGNGFAGVSGVVSNTNSLVGGNANDRVSADGVTALNNGNYVVKSLSWNGNRGAVTWGSGATGVSGVLSETNSLVGANSNDQVGYEGADYSGVVPLSNGNYVVLSPFWNSHRGAVTWGSGAAGVSGALSQANSLIGSNPDDWVGSRNISGNAPGVILLSNGNYVVFSPNWNGSRGAVTWASGAAGVSGTVSDVNSLVGSNPNDRVGVDVFGNALISVLSNGNYVVRSPFWNANRGAATWGSGATGIAGIISNANSLVGSNADDQVGNGGTTIVGNGNYVVTSSNWNANRGAVTWGNATTGVRGTISEANSLVGTNLNDHVGSSPVTLLSDGNYVVTSYNWNANRGAATWGSGTTGVSGIVSEANSLVGTNLNDQVGFSGMRLLSDGNYVVTSSHWNANRGALTWVNAATGQTFDGQGIITPQNSLVGRAVNSALNSVVLDAVNHTFLGRFTTDGGGRVTAGLFDPDQLTYVRAQAQTIAITPDFLTRTLNTSTAVLLQASNDITVNSAITVTAGGAGGALTLQAGRSILINASVTTDNGALTLIANDQLANGVVDSQRDPGPAVITMAGGAALNTGSGTLTIELRDGAGLTNFDSGPITLQTVVAGSISVVNNGPSAGSDVILGPVTTAGTQSYANPNGTTTITANLAAGGSMVTFNNAAILANGLTLGAGSDTFTFAGGTVAPAPGLLAIAGSLNLSSAATFSATLNGADPGSYSQITASGPIDLGSSILALTLGFTPELGDSFTLLSSAFGPIIGTFAGLEEGATFTQDGILFQITYQGGPGGQSVVLTRLA